MLDSGGTTEYAVTIDGSYNSEFDGPMKRPYRMQPGFGTGANFVPASNPPLPIP